MADVRASEARGEFDPFGPHDGPFFKKMSELRELQLEIAQEQLRQDKTPLEEEKQSAADKEQAMDTTYKKQKATYETKEAEMKTLSDKMARLGQLMAELADLSHPGAGKRDKNGTLSQENPSPLKNTNVLTETRRLSEQRLAIQSLYPGTTIAFTTLYTIKLAADDDELICPDRCTSSLSQPQSTSETLLAKLQQSPTAPLFAGAAIAFGSGIAGAIWYSKRKYAKEKLLEASKPQYIPSTAPKFPQMTPAEYAQSRIDARFFALRALGYGTLLAWGSAAVIAVGVGYALDVRNMKELSEKLSAIIPKRTSYIRDAILREERAVESTLLSEPQMFSDDEKTDLGIFAELKREWDAEVEARRRYHESIDRKNTN
ncbi:hypothetical protein BZG36_02970 [Bifiguratus adelaidae]|uniref:Uncharacterized protein n=1 Tax=Bifiguratus adelaidae TaxID=1938954 RepID=A0A261Y0U3_9FUNG|nr:hypothetical protein BZG36_02970 [Bifiguratus adelaidae]